MQSVSLKKKLALRLIDRGAVLIADDQTRVSGEPDGLYAYAPATIAGLLEVRGMGIVTVPYVEQAKVVLAVRIGVPERMPVAGEKRVIHGQRIPAMTVAALESSAPIKVERMLGLLAA